MLKLAKLNGGPEIFHSFQGEGKSLGKPSVFIRLSLCNLYCIWCDTDYTWNWEGTSFEHIYDKNSSYKKFDKSQQIVECTDQEIVDFVSSFDCDNIIITGGEPLVQQKQLTSLLRALKAFNPSMTVEVETNGTILPMDDVDQYVDQYNVSPKLANSGVKYSDRIKAKALDFFSANPRANFKFVVSQESDIQEISSLVLAHGIKSEDVYIMPEGLTAKDLLQKEMWVIALVNKYGFKYSDRIHIHKFGSRRGV